MNPLGILFSPRETIRNSIEKPSLSLAVVLVALPVIIASLADLYFGFELKISSVAVKFVLDVIFLLLSGIVFLLLVYLIGNRGIGEKFYGLITSLSLIKIIISAMLIVSVLFLPFMVSKPMIKYFVEFQKSEIGMNELQENVLSELNNNPNAFNLLPFAIFILIESLFSLFILYSYYLIISESSQKFSFAKKFFSWIIFVVFMLAFGFLSF